MSIESIENDLCKDCQMCCHGHMCNVIVEESEKHLFPAADFSRGRLADGRSFFKHACPHISESGCQIYTDRPKDCASFRCKTLARMLQGEITPADAKRKVKTVKREIESIARKFGTASGDLDRFKQIAWDWVSLDASDRNPKDTQRLLAAVKRLDNDFMNQSRLVDTLQANLISNDVDIKTPAYIVDDLAIDKIVSGARDVIGNSGAKLLYSVKANAVSAVLERLTPLVDGFSCSSLPEVQIVRQVAGQDAKIHFVGPGIAPDDAEELLHQCKNISFNSLKLFRRYGLPSRLKCGLRVNPHLSLNSNPKYDPCRPQSKLGISIYELRKAFSNAPEEFAHVEGLHVHNATGIEDFQRLAATVNIITETLPDLMRHIKWINLGGGYRIHTCKNPQILRETVRGLQDRYGLTVYLEPGTALVRKGCLLLSTVIDVFESEGQNIAVLDTSINHQLEGFIYGFPPRVANASRTGRFQYQLAGASCLAGDLLGTHRFDQPLDVGSRILFPGVGAYTHAFTTRYNGLNPPSIYQLQPDQTLRLRRHFGIEAFADVCGV